MKPFPCLFILAIFLALGCAHHPSSAPSGSPSIVSPQDQAAISSPKDNQPNTPGNSVEGIGEGLAGRNDRDPAGMGVNEAGRTMSVPPEPRETPETSVATHDEKADRGMYGDYVDEGEKEKKVEIADPLEPFNRAMYHFNDKLYFWVIKPVAQGYRKVVPEGARVSVSNFFTNLAAPIRFVNCVLQANFSGAASELGRFFVNTLWGIGGLFDLASRPDLNLSKQDEDFGQTLGTYGLGQGFYINWPIFGPSSPRDTVGMVGDFFLHPLSYVNPWEVSAGIKAYDRVNDTSLKIGDYESLTEAAIDPYIAIRDAYVQYRMNKVKARGPNQTSTNPGSGNAASKREETSPALNQGAALKP